MKTSKKQDSVLVVGCGYVGLTTAACLADLGHHVIGIDSSAERVNILQQGKAPFYEKGLDDLVASGLQSGQLEFAGSAKEKGSTSRIAFVCVPTPSLPEGSADLSMVKQAVTDLAEFMDPHGIIVLKSTVPVGTNKLVKEWLNRDDLVIASNPEFLQAGRAVHTFQNPDRIVLGADTEEALELLSELYEGVDAPIIQTDPQSAELIKYASNSYLATRLSFVNTIATLCEQGGGDASTVLAGMGLDHRIGQAFLQPGPGWGGSCFPKDTKALAAVARDKGADTTLLDATLEANEKRFDQVVSRLGEIFDQDFSGKKIAIWGLTFKAGTDDLRDSPSLEIAERLLNLGAVVEGYDPMVQESPNKNIELSHSALSAVSGADALLVLTEWAEFVEVQAEDVVQHLNESVVFDVRGVLDEQSYLEAGANFIKVGFLK